MAVAVMIAQFATQRQQVSVVPVLHQRHAVADVPFLQSVLGVAIVDVSVNGLRHGRNGGTAVKGCMIGERIFQVQPEVMESPLGVRCLGE